MSESTYLETALRLALPEDADAEAAFAALADAFHALPDETARDVGLDLATRDLTMTFTFEGVIAPDEAVRRALSLGRAAFREAGLHDTAAAWDRATWSVVPSDAAPAALPA